MFEKLVSKTKSGVFWGFSVQNVLPLFYQGENGGKTFRGMLPIYVRERYACVRTFSNSNLKIER